MRDAFGGVFMMRLMLAFITIFVAFSAVSLNYAKAFRIKNQVIDVIEQMEIQKIDDISTHYDKLDQIKKNSKYNINCDKEGPITDEKSKVIGVCRSGIVITVNSERSNDEFVYYNVITYGGWNLGSLNMLLALGGKSQNSEKPMMGSWAISGEAKVRKHGRNESTTPTIPDAPFSQRINGDRCYKGSWIRVTYCQPEDLKNAHCILENNTKVLRKHLTVGSGCKLPNIGFTEDKNGNRCNRDTGKWIYITTCQPADVRGAHCKLKDGTTIIRTYLTNGEGC